MLLVSACLNQMNAVRREMCHAHRGYHRQKVKMGTLCVHLIQLLLVQTCLHQVMAQEAQQVQAFNPLINARCERGLMIINVVTTEPYYGIIHTKDYRKKSDCSVIGQGAYSTTLTMSSISSPNDEDYCGVHKHRGSDEERSVVISVRIHKTLERSEDKYFLITCSQSSFVNSQNTRSRVSLKLLDQHNQDTNRRLIHGNPYILRVSVEPPDSVYGLFVRNCVTFSTVNSTEIELIDSNGCPSDPKNISPFNYSNASNHADAHIDSMFKFSGNNRVHLQCEVYLCLNGCDEAHSLDCSRAGFIKGGNPLPDSSIKLITTTTVFVVDPGEDILNYIKFNETCDEWRFPWLITLCACLGILLLVMLIVNLFLCSSLSCTCTKTDVVEKEPSEIADYDPYKIDWSANQVPMNASTYGSRSSLAKHHYDGRDHDFNGSDLPRPNSRFSKQSQHYANY